MFGQPNEVPHIPRETVRAARAVFSRNNFYILVGEQLEIILRGIDHESLSESTKISRGGGAILPLITFFQFVENLTDGQAMDAMRTRIDWKYALHLPVTAMLFHQNALCEFRQKVIQDPASQCEFQKLVNRLILLNPPYSHAPQSFETLALLSSICSANFMNWALEAMRAALGTLASRFPDWLRQIAQPHWYWRFNSLSSYTNPVSSMRQQDLPLENIGADIHHLLQEVENSNIHEISELKEIKTLYLIWEQQFETQGAALPAQSNTSSWNKCDSCKYYAG
jgi:transposase